MYAPLSSMLAQISDVQLYFHRRRCQKQVELKVWLFIQRGVVQSAIIRNAPAPLTSFKIFSIQGFKQSKMVHVFETKIICKLFTAISTDNFLLLQKQFDLHLLKIFFSLFSTTLFLLVFDFLLYQNFFSFKKKWSGHSWCGYLGADCPNFSFYNKSWRALLLHH